MAKRHLDDVELLVVDPDQNVRNSLRHTLHDHGFRQMSAVGSWSEICEYLEYRMPDLLISDCMLPDGDFCDLTYQLRHRTIGTNPFVPVIALTWQPTSELVARIINSGADALLTKPISANQLVARIQTLIDSRKPFIVTSEYIGPDRRKNSDRPSNIPFFEVPNALREKILGLQPGQDLQARIDGVFETINMEKLDRYAVQICWLVERIVPGMSLGPPDDTVKQHLDRLVTITEDTARRMIDTLYEHVTDLCLSLIAVTRKILLQGDKPVPRDARLLVPLSEAIRAGFRGDRQTVEAARKISEEISR